MQLHVKFSIKVSSVLAAESGSKEGISLLDFEHCMVPGCKAFLYKCCK